MYAICWSINPHHLLIYVLRLVMLDTQTREEDRMMMQCASIQMIWNSRQAIKTEAYHEHIKKASIHLIRLMHASTGAHLKESRVNM